MSTPVPTPDWQRGIVSPQILLATVPKNVNSTSVALPPNTESLIISGSSIDPLSLYVVGNTTGLSYPVFAANRTTISSPGTMAIALVSPAMDSGVTINNGVGQGTPWYVAADAGVRTVNDLGVQSLMQADNEAASALGITALGIDGAGTARAIRTDAVGSIQLTGPTNAVAVSLNVPGTNYQVIAPPPAGQYNRLWGADYISNTPGGGSIMNLFDQNGNTVAYLASGAQPTLADHAELGGLPIAGKVTATSATNGGILGLRYSVY